MDRPPLLVFVTVDTEIWPFTSSWRETALKEETQRYIEGLTRGGSYGLPYQMDLMGRHGLKGIFFTEALFACEMGIEPLRRIVDMVQMARHDVELHLHTEWLAKMTQNILPGRTGTNIKDFSEEEQTILLARGLRNLRDAGAERVSAFRAGNFGASLDTLRALARNGIVYDTSYNVCYLGHSCEIRTPEPLLQPSRIGGVYEFPVTHFRDYPGHFRPVQLCACSFAETEHALNQAWARGWHSLVIVSHSFELLKRRIRPGHPSLPDRIVINRFERLCEFLGRNRDRFQTSSFKDIEPAHIPAAQPARGLQSRIDRTALRYMEQALSQIV